MALASSSFEAEYEQLKKAVLEATQSCHSLPAPADIPYHRTLSRECAKELDAASETVLTLANTVLNLVKDSYPSGSGSVKGKGKATVLVIREEEDIVNSSEFQTKIVDLVDRLLENVDSNLEEWLGKKKEPLIEVGQPKARVRASNSGARLPAAILNAKHLAKPQVTFRNRLSNDRNAVFVPATSSQINNGETLNPCIDQLSNILDQLPPPLLQEEPVQPSPMPTDSFETVPYTFVDSVELFEEMLALLANATEIAVDIEHHDYRSYHGFVCLLQISIPGQDFVVDAIQPDVRARLHKLNTTFTDPKIIKVFHGADSDIQWLQRDFGVYVVGMFDTYAACKYLEYPQKSLASLLQRFCAFEADKRYQLADWRVRPIPEEMVGYARADTHFLLFVYKSLLCAIRQRAGTKDAYSAALQDIFTTSAATCAQSYSYPSYVAENGLGPVGWRSAVHKWGKQMVYGLPPMPVPFTIGANESYKAAAPAALEFYLYRALHDWRDRIARAEDESPRFVLTPPMLFRLAERRPLTGSGVLSTLSPISQPVHNRREELAEFIREKVEEWGHLPDTKAPSLVAVPEVIEADTDDVPMSTESVKQIPTKSEAPLNLWEEQTTTLLAAKPAMFRTAKQPSVKPALLRATSSSLFSRPNTQVSANAAFAKFLQKVHSSLSLVQSFEVNDENASFETEPASTLIPVKVENAQEVSADDLSSQDVIRVADTAVKKRKKSRNKDKPSNEDASAKSPKRQKVAAPRDTGDKPVVDILDVEPEAIEQRPVKKKKKDPHKSPKSNGAPSFKSFPKPKGTMSQTFAS